MQDAISDSLFHAGERAVQDRVGVREAIEPWARKVVRTWMPEQHREFYGQLPFVVAAARDEWERPWVTLLAGEPGFIRSPDPESLQFDSALPDGDALATALVAGTELGLLGIDLGTRRRNRVNGTIVETGPGGVHFAVGQAFGNCPQYISARHWYPVEVAPKQAPATRSTALSESMQAWIRGADTFFVGSGYRGDPASPSTGMDASHRGGPAGFVRVDSPTRLVFPDYAGNNHFNTIGNLVSDPRVALLFVDFDTGGLLQLTGRAAIDWDSPAVAEHASARRLVVVDIEEIVDLAGVLPIRFSSTAAESRPLRLVERRRESEDVVSFWFDSADGDTLPDFEAGQHLPLHFDIAGHDEPVSRTYSLSNGPGEGRYRISVKREPRGLVSRLLHDTLSVGTIVNSRPPGGDFMIGPRKRPIVLISAGVGTTPVVSMLYALSATASDQSITFLHAARNGQHHALARETRMIANTHDNVTLKVAYSQPREDDIQSRDYDFAGRIDAHVMRAAVPDLDADYFMCGPAPFLNAMSDILSGFGVDDGRVHTEQF